MNFGNLDFETLLEVLNISKIMLMKTDKLSGKIEKYINENVSKSEFCLSKEYLLVENYCLKSVRNSVVRVVHLDFSTRSWRTSHCRKSDETRDYDEINPNTI